ncbi:Putative ATPase subunit of terminase (gpP-like) [Flavobacterium resistens]|uniref:ATPase subunit of terminase (GpP-like) n=2 Tax=Flavobacterium resistens TaxID=443612 RepID=A0A521B5Y2_9FLAO|nr:Putative ATPase subunit of terminase (gpP-like) [Flavobacterium resistens]
MGTTNKTKGRMTASESDYKKSQGKDLFVKGFSMTNIAEIIDVGIKTLSKWREDYNWQDEKDLNSLKPSTIRNLTLKMALAIEKGEPLPYKADDVSKIVAAFDRISDSKKKAVYTMESIDGFSQWMIVQAGNNTGKKRDELLEEIKTIRPYFDRYVTELLQND